MFHFGIFSWYKCLFIWDIAYLQWLWYNDHKRSRHAGIFTGNISKLLKLESCINQPLESRFKMVSRPSVLDLFSFFGLFWDGKKHHILKEMFANPEPEQILENRFQEIPIGNNHMYIFDSFVFTQMHTWTFQRVPNGS